MKRIIALVSFIFIICSISQSQSFKLIDKASYEIRVNQHKDIILKRYVVFPSIRKDKNLLFTAKSHDDRIAGAVFLLKRGKNKTVKEYLDGVKDIQDIDQFIYGLYWFCQENYTYASKALHKYDSNEYLFLKYLLMADCHYELNKNTIALKEIIDYYQKALDQATDENDKALVKNRIKLIKYS